MLYLSIRSRPISLQMELHVCHTEHICNAFLNGNMASVMYSYIYVIWGINMIWCDNRNLPFIFIYISISSTIVVQKGLQWYRSQYWILKGWNCLKLPVQKKEIKLKLNPALSFLYEWYHQFVISLHVSVTWLSGDHTRVLRACCLWTIKADEVKIMVLNVSLRCTVVFHGLNVVDCGTVLVFKNTNKRLNCYEPGFRRIQTSRKNLKCCVNDFWPN